MAKAPRQGEAKTRLVPPLSLAEAAALSAAFIRDAALNIMAAAHTAPISAHIAYSPLGSEAEFAALLPDGVQLLPPKRIGLGANLHDAAADLLGAGYAAACLVNADSPTLPTTFLIEAAHALMQPGERVVFGPAEDGGYYLIGLKKPYPRLFEDIAWSTDRVFEQSIARAAELGLDQVVLPSWYDVDDRASLQRLIAELSTDHRHSQIAPHTTALVRTLARRL